MSDATKKLSAADAALLASIERGLQEAAQGHGRVTTPEQIARRKVGRPAGAVASSRKEPVTLRLDADVAARWRASGKGWQTRAALALAKSAPR